MSCRIIVYIALGLLMVVSIIEFTFISLTISFLHGPASKTFSFNWNGSTYKLGGQPKHLILGHGYASNAAAVTAFLLIGCGGIVALYLRSRPKPHRISIIIYRLWLVINVLALFLTLGAFVYFFSFVINRRVQRIEPSVAAGLDGAPYPLHTWSPQKWFTAVLELDLASTHERAVISRNLKFMAVWRGNLLLLFIVQFFEAWFALWDAHYRSAGRQEEKKDIVYEPVGSSNRRTVTF